MRRPLLVLLLASCTSGTATITDVAGDTDLATTDAADTDGAADTDTPGDTDEGSDTDTLSDSAVGGDSFADTAVVSTDLDGDGYTTDDCAPVDGTIHPNAVEVCDQVDQDCDGIRDEGTPCVDDDLDGYTDQSGDCDDADATIHQGATEVRDGVDQDCDGLIDDGTTAWDDDGDCRCEVAPCVGTSSPRCGALTGDDCNDAAQTVFPGATEVCNGVDDNCDALVDGPGVSGGATWYPDADGDGFGGPGATVTQCGRPAGYANNRNDCYDANADAHPGVTAFFTADRGDGSYDYNCDRSPEPQYASSYQCIVGCIVGTVDGWTGDVPDCGEVGDLGTGCQLSLGWPYCDTLAENTTRQGCR